MKLSPILLFLILLFVLIGAIIFSQYHGKCTKVPSDKEGFISFRHDYEPMTYVLLPQYTKNDDYDLVLKVYDSLFFDVKNGNLIEAHGQIYVDSATGANANITCTGNICGNVSTNASSVSSIYITKRNGNTNTSPYNTIYSDNTKLSVTPVQTPESGMKMVSSYNSFVYNTIPSDANNFVNPDQYQVVYVAWGADTYMHVIKRGGVTDVNGSKNILTCHVSENGGVKEKIAYANSNITVGAASTASDTKNGSYLINTVYDSSHNVYQITKQVQYDVSNGALIINKPDNTILIYDRTGAATSTKPSSTLQTSTFNAWTVSDSGDGLVLYIADGLKTVVAALKPEAGAFKIANLARFTRSGLDSGTSDEQDTISSPQTEKGDSFNTHYKEYLKLLAYWTTHGNDNDIFSEDYMLKTQIVPPVCPKCPSCSTEGVCNSCGGNGGSGTSGVASDKKTGTASNAVGGVANNVIDTVGDTLKSTGSGATNLARETVGGATSLARETVGGAAGLARETAGGAVGLARETVGGATNLVREVGGEARELIRDVGSGVSSLLRSSGQSNTGNGQQGSGQYPNAQYTSGQYNAGAGTYTQPALQVGNTPIDPYSYNGALQNKGGNYIPVTADFSAFAR